jgi:hypothetical protein
MYLVFAQNVIAGSIIRWQEHLYVLFVEKHKEKNNMSIFIQPRDTKGRYAAYQWFTRLLKLIFIDNGKKRN